MKGRQRASSGASAQQLVAADASSVAAASDAAIAGVATAANVPSAPVPGERLLLPAGHGCAVELAGPLPSCSECQARWSGQNKPEECTQSRSGQYTVCEVALHRTPGDCWLHAHGKVYDVTSMITEHPGGTLSIIRHAGQRCDQDFDFHGADAQKLWSRYCIGKVVPCEANPRAPGVCVIQ